ncbi:MAG: hypothetical protein LBC70_05410 [Chitinispirillales bacterium]|nr:hypothetical protein [Chitinispirillales bacterium]
MASTGSATGSLSDRCLSLSKATHANTPYTRPYNDTNPKYCTTVFPPYTLSIRGVGDAPDDNAPTSLRTRAITSNM